MSWPVLISSAHCVNKFPNPCIFTVRSRAICFRGQLPERQRVPCHVIQNTHSLDSFMRYPLFHHASLLLLLMHWANASDPSFLSDTLVRKDQLQQVLGHEPAQQAACVQTVPAKCSCIVGAAL